MTVQFADIATAANDDKGVAKLTGSIVQFTETGSWLLYKDVDLTGITSVLFSVNPTKIGGRLSIHLDKPDGKELSFVSIDPLKKPQKTGADQKSPEWKIVGGRLTPEKGTHNIYIVYHDPADAKSSIWTTLYLDWIEFRK